MAGKSRIHYPGALYHFVLRGNGGEAALGAIRLGQTISTACHPAQKAFKPKKNIRPLAPMELSWRRRSLLLWTGWTVQGDVATFIAFHCDSMSCCQRSASQLPRRPLGTMTPLEGQASKVSTDRCRILACPYVP